MSLRDSLLEERRGYVNRGLDDRVAQVDAAIAALPDDEPVVLDDAGDNGGIDPNSSRPAEPVAVEPEDEGDGAVETPEKPDPSVETPEAKPSRSRSRSKSAG